MPTLEIKDYYDGLMSDVLVSSQIEGTNPEVEFLNTVLELLADAGEFDEYIPVEDGVDGAGRWRIDGYSFDETGTTLNYFISIFVNEDQFTNLTQTDIKKVMKKVTNFITFINTKDIFSSLEVASEVFQAAQQIKGSIESLKQIDVYIISNKPMSNRLNDLQIEQIDDYVTQLHIWDLQRIFKLEMSGRDREDMVLDFSDNPVKCLVTSESNEETISLLAVMDGKTLFDTYQKWKGRLLEQNVRTYLQNRSKVNRGIRATIKEEPERFFAYNNGLTTTAEGIEFIDETKSAIKNVKNFQIVNGAQTTSSIFAAKVNDNLDVSKVSVQMKLTVVPPDKVKNIVPKISRYANSQNKVNDADFFSNHPFHIEMETISRRISAPPKQGDRPIDTYWFYERTRGQYLDTQAYMKASERTKFQAQNPRSQLVTKTDLAKFENSWLQKPSSVSKGAQANFSEFAKYVETEWNKNKTNFNELYYKMCISHAIIIKALEKAVSKTDWYAGFRANIVTYTISYFSKCLEDQKLSLDYEKLFKKQVAPTEIINELLIISMHINSHLHSYSGNLTTYSKSTAAWDKIKVLKIKPNFENFDNYLWTKSSFDKALIESKSVQKEDNTLNLEMKVHLLTSTQWSDIKKYLINMEMATETYVGLLNKAIGQPGSTYMMSSRQLKVLAKLIALFEKDNGLLK